MKSDRARAVIQRILRISAGLTVVVVVAAVACTRSWLCSIIAFSAALIAQLGFLVMTRALDRYMRLRRGMGPFFMVSLAKLVVIVLFFLIASRISEQVVLFFLLGLSVVVMAVLVEGGIQLLRSLTHGRTRVNHR
ncbi:MAG TPA: hypothetical protein ENN40_03495 [Candidatus Aminicenantes bacterium]|nr:hypothetical protein [Candidatus Aminicenantes bacterium]